LSFKPELGYSRRFKRKWLLDTYTAHGSSPPTHSIFRCLRRRSPSHPKAQAVITKCVAKAKSQANATLLKKIAQQDINGTWSQAIGSQL
jgi:hypothetical protein